MPRIVTLGGDHTTTLSALRSTYGHWGAVSVIHFDSHIGMAASSKSLRGTPLTSHRHLGPEGAWRWYLGLCVRYQAGVYLHVCQTDIGTGASTTGHSCTVSTASFFVFPTADKLIKSPTRKALYSTPRSMLASEHPLLTRSMTSVTISVAVSTSLLHET